MGPRKCTSCTMLALLDVPSKQRVAGSNPARRAGQRHITILSLIVRSPNGEPTGANGRCSGTSSARVTETGLPRCQRHVASVITARQPTDLLGDRAGGTAVRRAL